MWHVVNQKKGVSALGLQKALGLGGYQTAWAWLHKLRRAMARPGRERLSGLVEVDEVFIGGKRSGKGGRGAERKALIFMAAEDVQGHIGRIRPTTPPNASGDALAQAAMETIDPGSRVRSDDRNGDNLPPRHGYRHIPVAHKDSESGDSTPLVHLVASLFKRWWQGTQSRRDQSGQRGLLS